MEIEIRYVNQMMTLILTAMNRNEFMVHVLMNTKIDVETKDETESTTFI